MYFTNKNKLLNDLVADKVQETTYVKYLIISIVIVELSLLYSKYNVPIRDHSIISFEFIYVGFGILNLIVCFFINGGDKGHNFIKKYFCINFILEMRILLFLVPPYILLFILLARHEFDPLYIIIVRKIFYNILIFIFSVMYFKRISYLEDDLAEPVNENEI